MCHGDMVADMAVDILLVLHLHETGTLKPLHTYRLRPWHDRTSLMPKLQPHHWSIA